MNSVIQCFNTCFFFFGGFEVYATAGKNVQNPNRNVGLGVILVMAFSTLFYILTLIFFFGAINPFNGGFHQNEPMSF
jgi:amino acid transporter